MSTAVIYHSVTGNTKKVAESSRKHFAARHSRVDKSGFLTKLSPCF